MFWGLSEALDLYLEYLNAFKSLIDTNDNISSKENQTVTQVVTGEMKEEISPDNGEVKELKLEASELLEKTSYEDDSVDDHYISQKENSENDNLPQKENESIALAAIEVTEEKVEDNGSKLKMFARKEKENGENRGNQDAIEQRKLPEQSFEKDTGENNEKLNETETTNISVSGNNLGMKEENEKEINICDIKERLIAGVEEDKETDSKKNWDSQPQPTELNILMFGAGDPRHVLKTMSKLFTHRCANGSSPKLNFYLLEGCIEIVARNIALLGIALENPDNIGLLNKTHLFMDVYGNALMRPTSHRYLVGKAKTLIKMVTDSEMCQRLAPLLNIEDLKYRERDGLEDAFHFWLPKSGHKFNIKTYWDDRVRQLLGMRYAYRDGAFDWDLNMTLKDRKGQQICNQVFQI